jgi:hypothetical protein
MASALPGKAHAVGSQIWFVYRVNKSKMPVKLSRQYSCLMKFNLRTWHRALIALERAGLIVIDRHKGRAPLVTITLDQEKVSVLKAGWRRNCTNGAEN